MECDHEDLARLSRTSLVSQVYRFGLIIILTTQSPNADRPLADLLSAARGERR